MLPINRRGDMADAAPGLVSRASPVHTVMRKCTKDEGGPFELGVGVHRPECARAVEAFAGSRNEDLRGRRAIVQCLDDLLGSLDPRVEHLVPVCCNPMSPQVENVLAGEVDDGIASGSPRRARSLHVIRPGPGVREISVTWSPRDWSPNESALP